MPSSHRTSRITKMVHSMTASPWLEPGRAKAPARPGRAAISASRQHAATENPPAEADAVRQ